MVLAKYNFFLGKVESNFTTNDGRINTDTGEYEVSTLEKVSSFINAPESRVLLMIKKPHDTSMSKIFYYGENKEYIGYQPLDEGTINLDEQVKFYIISYSNTDVAFENKDYMCSLTRCYPHYKNISKKCSKESGQEFFRTSLEGQINVFNKDYEYIQQSNLEDKLLFVIYKYNGSKNSWLLYYKGEFNKSDCKFDFGKKKCELKVTPVDGYTDILNKYDNTYDLIKLAPAVSKIDIYKRSLMQVYILGASSISNFFGGTYWESDVNEAIDNNVDIIKKYHFSYVKAGNEFYVKNAGIQEVNGVYAGINGKWTQQNGYTCYLDLSVSTFNYLYIKRNSDNVILYKSTKTWSASNTNNIYIGRENVEMVNVNDSGDKFTIESPFVYHIYQRLLCDVDSIEDSQGVKNTFDIPHDDFVTDNRNYKKCIGLSGGLFFCSSKTVDEPTKYGMDDFGKYFTDKFIPYSSGISRVLPICRSTWANASLWYAYDDIVYKVFEPKLRKKYTLRDGYAISDVIKVLLKKIDPNIKHEATAEYSRFLYDTKTPINMNRFYVYITPKSNILKGDYDQAAKKAEISLEDVMNMLKNCFKCYWYIEDNKLKIEHIYFFMNGGSYSSKINYQLDFSKGIDLFNKIPLSYFQTEIEYDKSDLSSRYEFSWMDDCTDLFGQVTMDVNSNYVQKDKTESIGVDNFSPDIDFMLFNPSNFSEDGFALLCPIKNGSSLELPIVDVGYLLDENGNRYEATVQNWYASWIYLCSNFYVYDMPTYNFVINSLGDYHALDVKKSMKHSIEFQSEDDLDELGLIKTNIGNGKIDEFSINIDTRHVKVDLVYKP